MADQGGEQQTDDRRLVFISHSGRDRWVARQIARAITEHGAEAFLDEAAIEVGEDFQVAIRSALSRADEFVVLWTPTALERSFIWTEVGAAWLRQIPIVELLYGVTATELQARSNFPVFLKALDMIDLDDVDTYLGQLGRRATNQGPAIGGTDDG